MAIRAGKIELAPRLHEQLVPFGDEGLELRIVPGFDGDTARLLRDKSGERQQVVAFIRKRRRLLMSDTAQIDALLQIDGTAEFPVEGRVAGAATLHAGARILMAIGAGLARCAGLALP